MSSSALVGDCPVDWLLEERVCGSFLFLQAPLFLLDSLTRSGFWFYQGWTGWGERRRVGDPVHEAPFTDETSACPPLGSTSFTVNPRLLWTSALSCGSTCPSSTNPTRLSHWARQTVLSPGLYVPGKITPPTALPMGMLSPLHPQLACQFPPREAAQFLWQCY